MDLRNKTVGFTQDQHPHPGLSRRKFLKCFVLGSAISSFAGRLLCLKVLGSCQPSASGAGILQLDISQFPSLQDVNGSVRLLFSSLLGSRPSGPLDPVLVNRGSGNQFYTLSGRCTHQGCAVAGFDPSFAACLCPCHGSRFAIDGAVLAGPATLSLASYTNSFDGRVLCIEIPGLAYNVSGQAVQNANAPRFSLQFPTFLNSQYQILSRQALSDSGIVVPFATTLAGSTTNTVLNGTGNPATVYVDRTSKSGFYAVSMLAGQG
jgi:nitrite reductase/ring-hydroxylating ferredoxin subunit